MSDSPCCDDPDFEYSEADHCETHGLDCGPYERWTEQRYTCQNCGEWFTPKELERISNLSEPRSRD